MYLMNHLMNCIPNILIFFTIFLFGLTSLQAQVWPGDINNNGEVSSFDLLFLGYAYGQQGASRPNPSTNWIAQTAAPLWGTSFPGSQLDISYGDCDGNGVIDLQDVTVIQQNYGLQNSSYSPGVILTGIPGQDPTVEIKRTTNDTLTPGALEAFEIHFGQNHVNNFYGISFTISYDTAYVDSVVNVYDAAGWITNNGQDAVIQVYDSYIQPNSANGKDGRIDVAYSRINGLPVFGFGFVGLFSIIMEENVSGKTGSPPIDFEFEVLNIEMVDEALNIQPTVPSISEFIILTNNQTPIIKEPELLMFPNPASSEVTLFSEQVNIEQLEIIDINGQRILDITVQSTEITIPIQDLSNGMYIVKLSTPHGLVIRKLLISN